MDYAKLDRYANREAFLEDLQERIYAAEMQHHGCSQVIVQTFLDVFEEENQLVSMASSPFAAGMAFTGNTCGALIGGIMVLGMAFGRRSLEQGMDGILTGARPVRKLVRHFSEQPGRLNCRDITGTDLADPAKAQAYFDGGGLEKCAAMMVDVGCFAGNLLYDEKERLEKQI